MQVLDKEVLSQLVGGILPAAPGETHDGGGAGGVGGGGGGGGDGGSGGGGDSGFGPNGGYAYDLRAVGIEGGQEAVVTIRGAIPVFDNPPPNATIGQEPPAWEGSLRGIYSDPSISIYHEFGDNLLAGYAGVEASAAGKAFIEGALKGAGAGEKVAGRYGHLGGLVIGGFVATGSYFLMQRDHPKKDNQTWIDKDGVRHQPRGMASDDDGDHLASYTGPAGGAVMQMVA